MALVKSFLQVATFLPRVLSRLPLTSTPLFAIFLSDRTDDKPFIVLQRRPNEFFMDHVCSFCITYGPGVHGQAMDALFDLLLVYFKGPNAKWVDELAQVRFPRSESCARTWQYAFDLDDIFTVTSPL